MKKILDILEIAAYIIAVILLLPVLAVIVSSLMIVLSRAFITYSDFVFDKFGCLFDLLIT